MKFMDLTYNFSLEKWVFLHKKWLVEAIPYVTYV